MIFLILTLCTNAALDDCQVYQIGQFERVRQCEAMVDIYRDTLGRDGDLNYRMECLSEDEK